MNDQEQMREALKRHRMSKIDLSAIMAGGDPSPRSVDEMPEEESDLAPDVTDKNDLEGFDSKMPSKEELDAKEMDPETSEMMDIRKLLGSEGGGGLRERANMMAEEKAGRMENMKNASDFGDREIASKEEEKMPGKRPVHLKGNEKPKSHLKPMHMSAKYE